MDTNNLDKWWYGLPENTRQAIGNDEIWEKLDMPSRSALHRYSRLRIYGTAKDRDGERTLLNEIACGLGDLALVRKNGIALEEMCNGSGEFYDEYQDQFNILYDNYGHILENISWPDWIGHTIPTNRELVRLLVSDCSTTSCVFDFIEVHSIVSASRFFHMPTYLRVVIECQSRFFPFFPAFSRNCPDYFLHTSGSSSFRSLSDLGAR